MRKVIRSVTIVLLLLSFGLCLFACKGKDEPDYSSITDRFDLTKQVLDFIDKTYYGDLDYDLADIYTAYGLIGSLGQYNYINNVADLLASSSDGKGFGLIIRNTKYNERIIDFILDGSPFLAESNGYLPARGDEITQINGNRVSGLDTDVYSEFLSTLPSDREVSFTLKHGEDIHEVCYQKVDFDFPYCVYIDDLPGVPSDFGYIWLRSFTLTKDHKTEDEFREAVKAYNRDGNRALILDLRGNGGGSSTVLSTVASALIGENVPIGTTLVEVQYEKKGYSSFVRSIVAEYRVDTPIYVLCDGKTASASEALIGIMKAQGTLTALIGQATVGKGVAQNGTDDSLEDSVGYFIDKALDENGEEREVGAYLVQVIVGKYYIIDSTAEGGKYCMHEQPFVPDVPISGENVISQNYGEDVYIHAAIEDYNSK